MIGKILALSGWRSSGKDTTADYLESKYGFIRRSFAARLKDLVSNLYGVPRADLDHPTRKEMPLHNLPVISTDSFTEFLHLRLQSELRSGYWTPRALCILEGSTKRAVSSNFWIRSIASEIMENPNRNYVITDMRYKSEADTLRILIPQILTVRISKFDSIDTEDPSERDLDNYNFDINIQNRGTKEDLYESIEDNIIDALIVDDVINITSKLRSRG